MWGIQPYKVCSVKWGKVVTTWASKNGSNLPHVTQKKTLGKIARPLKVS